ncbi:MAG: hypothetical protein DRH26_03645 [Deltaproteobacteria bacterium]|nr:MAG: hypothetical protein DRH26_03645 [Deltaproteobacteria bacterium]
MTRFCFNPKDPTYRYTMTHFLMEAGFVECPAPGIPIPPTLMAGPGGVLDQTAASLATTIRKKMGADPSEEDIKILSDLINRADLKALKKVLPNAASPVVDRAADPPVAGPPSPGAMVEPDQVVPTENLVVPEERVINSETGEVTIKETRTSDIREMTSIPLVEVTESADDYTTRIFKKPLKNTDKTTILNYGMKKQKVTMDMSKTKPQLIKDLQMLEIHDASKKG